MNKLLTGKGISFERLDTLVKVVTAGSVAAAADGNASKQSLYSRQIRELEEALGFPLMDRSTTPHKVTEAAREISKKMGGFELLLKELMASESRKTPLVTIGAIALVARYLVIPEINSELSWGGTGVTFKYVDGKEAINDLREKRIDIAVITGDAAADGLESTEPVNFGWQIMGAPDLLPAGRKELHWKELGKLPFAAAMGRNNVTLTIRKCLEEYPDGPSLAMECEHPSDAIEAARGGNMLAVVPGFVQRIAKKEGLVMRKVKEFGKIERQLRVLWREGERGSRSELVRIIHVLSRFR